MRLTKIRKFIVGSAIVVGLYLSLPILHSFIPGSSHLKEVVEEEKINAAALFYSSETRSADSPKEIKEKLENLK